MSVSRQLDDDVVELGQAHARDRCRRSASRDGPRRSPTRRSRGKMRWSTCRRRGGRRRGGRGAGPGGAPRRSRAPRPGAGPARRSRGRTGRLRPLARPASAGCGASRGRRCRRRRARRGATRPSACSSPSSARGAARSPRAPQTSHGNVARSTSTLMTPVETRTGQGAKKLDRRFWVARPIRVDSPAMAPADDDAPIFLIGFMASGKTTVGRLLAERLGWAFVDLDKVIEDGGRARPCRTSSRRRGRPGSGSARPRRCARWRAAGRRWSRPAAARLAARRTWRRCWRRGACSGWRSRPRRRSGAREGVRAAAAGRRGRSGRGGAQRCSRRGGRSTRAPTRASRPMAAAPSEIVDGLLRAVADDGCRPEAMLEAHE